MTFCLPANTTSKDEATNYASGPLLQLTTLPEVLDASFDFDDISLQASCTVPAVR